MPQAPEESFSYTSENKNIVSVESNGFFILDKEEGRRAEQSACVVMTQMMERDSSFEPLVVLMLKVQWWLMKNKTHSSSWNNTKKDYPGRKILYHFNLILFHLHSNAKPARFSF